MRRLLYLALGFSLACGAMCYGESTNVRVGILITGLLLLAVLNRNLPFLKKMLLLVIGSTAGMLWFWQYETNHLQPLEVLDNTTQTVTIRASDYAGESTYGGTFSGTVTVEEQTVSVQVWLNKNLSIEPGTEVTGLFRFRTASALDMDYYQGKGIFLLAYQKEDVTIRQQEKNWLEKVAAFRHAIQGRLTEALPEDTAGFARALLLGDTSGLSYSQDTDLKISGIRHVVAVSGLHISIFFALIAAVTFRRRGLMALVGGPLLLLFAALAGFSPSVVRSCIMCGLMLLSLLVDKEYDGPTALSFAALVMLVANPMVITSVSFQLSVAAVAGILLFQAGISKWIGSFFGEQKGKGWKARCIRWFASSVSLSLSANILTTPLCAWYFGMVSLIGPVTNLLVLPVITLIFYGDMLVSLMGFFLPAVAKVFGRGLSWLIRYVLMMAGGLADFPLAAVYTASPYITVWLVMVYGLLILFGVNTNRKPGKLICCAVLGLALALALDVAESASDDVRFTVFDVGQGQCLLLQSNSTTFLVDCGGDYAEGAADKAAAELLWQGIHHLDGVILTHLDEDHSAGTELLLTRMETELLILPPERWDVADGLSARVIYAEEDLEISTGETVIRIFTADYSGSGNENSLCVLFDTEKCDILITGDRDGYGERSLLRNREIPKVDVLVAGHHGSKNSTCQELLDAIQPEIVCISAGQGNSYGHPHPELLNRLEEAGCEIYRTDIHGTITIRR